jgi:hypothetical protein
MSRPEFLWREFPLDPTPSPAPVQDLPPQPAGAPDPAATPAPTATPTADPAPEGTRVGDGTIELPGGATITFPEGNGTERAIAPAPAVQAPSPATEGDSGDLLAVSGQAGLYVVVVAVLAVLMARWLLNHTWRAAITVAVMLLGVAVLGLLVVRWATDLGLVS